MIFEKETLKKFFIEFFSLHGISVMQNFNSNDLWTAHLTPDISRFFENKSHLRLCFDRKLLPLHPDFSYVTIGSPILTQIKDAFNESRYHTCGYLKIDSSGLEAWKAIPSNLSFHSCTAQYDETRILYKGLRRFNFKLIITTDEKKEELFPVLIDTSTGKMANTVLLNLRDAEMTDLPVVQGKVLPGKPFQELREKAYHTAEIKIQPLLQSIEQELTEKTENDLQVAEEFYRNEYLNILKDKSLTKEEYEKNKQKCLDEIKKRCNASFELCLLNVVSYYIPIVRNILKIQKNGRSFIFASDYDVFRNTYEDLCCSKCGRAFTEIHCCEEHGIHCKDDLWNCFRCGKERCSNCTSSICGVSSCSRRICDRCTVVCPSCKRKECVEHIKICSGCNIECCIECSSVSDCEQKIFCLGCITTCTRCGRKVYKGNILRCQLCGAAVCPVCGTMECESCGKHICSTCFDKAKDGRLLCKSCIGYCKCCNRGYLKSELFSCSVGGEALCRECIAGKCNHDGCSRDILCREHSARCRVCNNLICSVHLSRCALCGSALCREHGSTCEGCRHTTCPEHFVLCSKCGRKLCASCAGRIFRTCHRDGKVLCPDHSAICPICGMHSCLNHLRQCPSCMKDSCREHSTFCSLCGREVCSACAAREFITCRKDGAKVCRACQSICHVCKNTFCRKDTVRCPGCSSAACPEHFIECLDCGIKVCPSCIDAGNRRCNACRSLHPIDESSDLIKEFRKQNGGNHPDLIHGGKWHLGRGLEYWVISCSRLTSMTYCAVHPETLQILEFRKKGLFGTIKRLFGA